MNICRFSVNRPILIIMCTLILMILGTISLNRLPIDLMPDITYPSITITTYYENAGPQEVESLVTRPIEEAVSAAPGVEKVTSTSSEGVSQVRISLTMGTDMDVAANDIRDRLDRISSRLPEEADRPMIRKYDMASFPIMIIGVSANMDPIQLRKQIDDQIKYRIERLPGVAALDIQGGLNREIHVDLDIDRIKALDLSIDRIISRIKEENINIPAGEITSGNQESMIRIQGEFTSLHELSNMVITVRQGIPILLKDIADIQDSWQKITRIIRIDGRPGVRLAVYKQSGTNTVEVAKAVTKEIQRLNIDIPQIRLNTIIDTSDYIERSIRNVTSSIVYGGALAVLILLMFLRNIGSTAVISISIPISIIATFTLMYFGGFTLNLMTLGGLALGVGMLVDNAIVVLENVFRISETGVLPKEAAITGSEEVLAAITASTLTTFAVFLPLIFVRGISGVMFKQLAWIVSFALACSLIVAITLVPMLSARLIRPKIHANQMKTKQSKGQLIDILNRFLKNIENTYTDILRYSINHPKTVIFCVAFLFCGCIGLIPLIGIEFMPAADESEVRINAEMAVGTKLELMDEAFRKIEAIVEKEVPEIRNTVSYIGGSTWQATGSHTAQMRIALKPISERNRSSEEIASVLRKKLSGVPGVIVRTRAGQGLFLIRIWSGSGERVEIEVRGHDLTTAHQLAEQVKQRIEKIDGITDVQLSLVNGRPEELIVIDRRKAADLKVNASAIAKILETVLSGTQTGYYREQGDEFKILVQGKDSARQRIQDILDLKLINADGRAVVLRNMVTVISQTGPVTIERRDQNRVVVIYSNISGRDLGSILKDVRKELSLIPVPKDFNIVLGGEYEEQQKAFRELMLSFILSLVIVYMVMASLYESLSDPLIVMFSVPFSAIGVILILFLTNTTFNVQSFIGCIMLGGIVVNNAILLVDHINLLQRRDTMQLIDAITEAGKRRLRPILMTATTTILGLFPLALGIGEGGEAQAPMARAVIGGLLSSTLITLILIPVIYAMTKKKQQLSVEVNHQPHSPR